MGPIRSPSGESARHEDAQKRLISATAAAQKRRVGGLAYESPAALRGWRSGEQAGTCSAVLGAAGESRERGRGWPPRAAKAKYRTIFSTGEATRRSNGPGQPREAAPRKSRKPRNVKDTYWQCLGGCLGGTGRGGSKCPVIGPSARGSVTEHNEFAHQGRDRPKEHLKDLYGP